MTKIITIAANKGGVAKSTTATTVAAKLALLNYPTLLADFGPQGSCSTLLGRDPEPGITNLFDRNEPLANVVRHIETVPALDLLPGNMDTRRSGNDKYKLDRSIQRTAQTFRDKLSGYQYTVIDTHPGDWYSELAICLADILVIPTLLEHMAIGEIKHTLTTAQQVGNQPEKAIVLPVMARMHTRESRTILAELNEALPNQVAEPIPDRQVLRECPAYGETIWQYRPTCESAAAYERLVTQRLLS